MIPETPSILDALSDSDCRAIIRKLNQPQTASEVAAHCDIPLSTVYRKLDKLEATPLVEQSYRLRTQGKHPQQYQRCADSLLVRLPAEQVEIQFVQRAVVD